MPSDQKPVALEPCPYAVQAKAVMDALWPVLGGNQTDADLWEDINLAVSNALSHTRPAPADQVDRLVREYRPSMSLDVLHSWAAEATATLTAQRAEIEALRGVIQTALDCLSSGDDHSARAELRAVLTRIGSTRNG